MGIVDYTFLYWLGYEGVGLRCIFTVNHIISLTIDGIYCVKTSLHVWFAYRFLNHLLALINLILKISSQFGIA